MSYNIIYINFTLISALVIRDPRTAWSAQPALVRGSLLVMNFFNTVWCCRINNLTHQMRNVYS